MSIADRDFPYRKPWMTDDQWFCCRVFAHVVGGFHHLNFSFAGHGAGVKISDFPSRWATFDFDRLTALVIAAHDNMVRVELATSGPRLIGFILWKRHVRDGAMHLRHPTIETALSRGRFVLDCPEPVNGGQS